MPLYRGWKVALAGIGVNFLVGINYTWSIFSTGLVEQRGWTHPQAALPYSFFLFCYALCMVPAGRAQDLWGPRPVITLGSMFAGGAFIVTAFLLHLPPAAALSWGLPLGIGLACCFASSTPAAMKWFAPEKRGLVAGLVVAGTGLSALVLSPLVQMLVREGAAIAFLISGLALMAGIFILAQLIENPRGRIGDLRELSFPKNQYVIFLAPQFYLLWVMFFLTTGAGVTFAAHLNNLMRVQSGFERGYIAVAVFALFNAAGRITAGLLSDRIGRIRAITTILSVMSLTLVFVLMARTPFLLIAAVSLLGLAYGGLYSIFPSAVVTFFGETNFGFNYGLIFTGLGAAGIFPYLGGVLFEAYGNYYATFALLLGATLLAVVISIRLRAVGSRR